MFDSLQQKLETTFRNLRGRGKLSDKDIEAALREIRLALLEADVNFKVVKDFCARIAEKAKAEALLQSLAPGHQVIKIVHQELINVLGQNAVEFDFRASPPFIIMLVGLQGSGKTTTAGKLARLVREQYRRRPLLVPADVYRPAAIEQLKTLGAKLELPVYDSQSSQDPVAIAKDAVVYAGNHGADTIIIDTAGRLQIDTELMNELAEISDAVQPHEILLVADSMTGQEALNVAQGFNQHLDIDGLILTKLDGDARGGAALSMREVTGKPIRFIGVGEKLEALELFHPERMASRILGMGDVLTLIEKAVKEVDLEESVKLQEKFKRDQFTLDDFLNQLHMMKKMGDMGSLLSMIPGLGKMAKELNPEELERELKHIEAIVLSMTREERVNHAILNGSRRKRIAKGSGTSVEAVNKLLKQFMEMKKMMKQLTKFGMGNLGQMLGGKGLGALMRNIK